MMARDYGIPPWQLEDEATLTWARRWLEWKSAEGQEAERKNRKWQKAR